MHSGTSADAPWFGLRWRESLSQVSMYLACLLGRKGPRDGSVVEVLLAMDRRIQQLENAY